MTVSNSWTTWANPSFVGGIESGHVIFLDQNQNPFHAKMATRQVPAVGKGLNDFVTQTTNSPGLKQCRGLRWFGHVASGTSEIMSYDTGSLSDRSLNMKAYQMLTHFTAVYNIQRRHFTTKSFKIRQKTEIQCFQSEAWKNLTADCSPWTNSAFISHLLPLTTRPEQTQSSMVWFAHMLSDALSWICMSGYTESCLLSSETHR